MVLLYSFPPAAPGGGRCYVSLERLGGSAACRPLLALLLASTLLLLLTSALLLALLALLLLASAGKATHEPLGLVRNSSNGVLRPLDGLPCVVCHLAGGVLRSSTLLLLLLISSAALGLRGARLLDGLLCLDGRGDLQVEEAPVGA